VRRACFAAAIRIGFLFGNRSAADSDLAKYSIFMAISAATGLSTAADQASCGSVRLNT
jgi:hypothetical protein